MTGIDLIKRFEGLKLESYLCPAGVPTIGYGHTGGNIKLGQKITEEQAEKLLAEEYTKLESKVANLVKVPLRQNQLDALVSFAYNLGLGALQGSTLLRKLNTGDYRGAAMEFEKWVYSKDPKTGVRIVLSGLERRRKAEKQLFEETT